MRTVFPWQVDDRLKAEFLAGWRGVLAKPQPDLAERLRRSRDAARIRKDDKS